MYDMIFVKITKQINKFTAEIASWVVFLMMLLSVADAVGRYVFKVTVFGAQDITQLMMVILTEAQSGSQHLCLDRWHRGLFHGGLQAFPPRTERF